MGTDDSFPVTSISRQNLIGKCQISEKEFNSLQQKSYEDYLRIYEITPN